MSQNPKDSPSISRFGRTSYFVTELITDCKHTTINNILQAKNEKK